MIMGNLTRDPEIKYTPKGTAVGDITIATNRKIKDGDEWKDEVTFVDVTLWGSTAENIGKYLTKGRGVFIEGRLQLESWDDKETGKKRSKLKVVGENVQFLPSSKSAESDDSTRKMHGSEPRRTAAGGVAVDKDDDFDDVPF